MKLIVEMEMPKFCIWRDDKNEPHRCPLLNEDDNCVPQDSNIWMGWNEQYAHCPIKGVLPDEHGDLIDREILLQTFQNADYETYNDYCEAFDTVEAAEIVIVAERKDDEQIH